MSKPDAIPAAREYIAPPDDLTEDERAALLLDDEAEDPATAEGNEPTEAEAVPVAAEKPVKAPAKAGPEAKTQDEQEEADAQDDDDEDAAAAAALAEAAAANAAVTSGTDDAAAAEAAAAASAEAAAAVAATDKPRPAPQQAAPLLVAEAPANAEADLAALATRKADLAQKFDDGDITNKEYSAQLDAIQAEVRTIERAVDKAELAASLAQQQQKNAWLSTASNFTSVVHPEYLANETLYGALDEATRIVATMKSMANATYDQILEKSHKMVLIDHPDAFGAAPAPVASAAAAPVAKPAAPVAPKVVKKALPPNLANVPAADISETGGDRFAKLNRLQDTDTVAYEEAMFAMSEKDRKAYEAA